MAEQPYEIRPFCRCKPCVDARAKLPLIPMPAPPVVKKGLTTDEVKSCFLDGAEGEFIAVDFNAWLDKIRDEARVAALEEAASKVHSRFEYGWLSTAEADQVASWLRWMANPDV